MHIFFFDPGKTTGTAWVHVESGDFNCSQFENPYHALNWVLDEVEQLPNSGWIVGVERYVGGGSMTADGIYTAGLVGFYTHYFEYFHGVEVVKPISQNRLSGLTQATELAKAEKIEGPHSWDALAHAIVRARAFR